jgi:hypothetical protein
MHPLTHWLSLEIHLIGKERRAQIIPTCAIFVISYGQNLRSTPGHPEPSAQYFFKNFTIGLRLKVKGLKNPSLHTAEN